MMGAARFVLRRLTGVALTLFILSVFLFSLVRLIPGDPAALIAGDAADPAELQRIRAEMGLNLPLPAQYARWLWRVLHGDFGVSLATGNDVAQSVARHFLVTVQVVGLAFVLAVAIAVPLGILAGRSQNRTGDTIIVSAATFFLSVPSFWVALLLILLFGATLGWLPAIGFVPFRSSPVEWLEHLVMPVTALVFVDSALLIRLMRAGTIEVLSQDYIDNARAKGLGERTILLRHVLKNALTPTLTMIGLILGSLLSGTVVIETIFGIPGLGRLLVDAVFARDYPVIQATLLFIGLLYIAINFCVDLLYPLVDPRVRAR